MTGQQMTKKEANRFVRGQCVERSRCDKPIYIYAQLSNKAFAIFVCQMLIGRLHTTVAKKCVVLTVLKAHEFPKEER